MNKPDLHQELETVNKFTHILFNHKTPPNLSLLLVLDNGAQALRVVHHVHGGVDGLDALQFMDDEVSNELARPLFTTGR